MGTERDGLRKRGDHEPGIELVTDRAYASRIEKIRTKPRFSRDPACWPLLGGSQRREPEK